MERIGQTYRLGIWDVPEEKADEFVEAWQPLSEWLAQHLPDERGAILLADSIDPTRFISFSTIDKPKLLPYRFEDPWIPSRVSGNLTLTTGGIHGRSYYSHLLLV